MLSDLTLRRAVGCSVSDTPRQLGNQSDPGARPNFFAAILLWAVFFFSLSHSHSHVPSGGLDWNWTVLDEWTYVRRSG